MPTRVRTYARHLVERTHIVVKLRVGLDAVIPGDFPSRVNHLLETMGACVGPFDEASVPSVESCSIKAVAYDFSPDLQGETLYGSIEIAIPIAACPPREGIPLLLAIVTYPTAYRFVRQYQIQSIDFPSLYIASTFQGPRFGSDAFFGDGAPRSYRLGLILKPRFAVTPEIAMRYAREFALAGIDYVSDDELTVNSSNLSFINRVKAVQGALAAVQRTTGRSIPYIANITSRYSRAMELAEIASEVGIAGVMVNTVTMGYDALLELASSDKVRMPIVANLNGLGLLTRQSSFSISEPVLCKLARLAGADAVYTGPLAGHIDNTPDRAAQYAAALTDEYPEEAPIRPSAAVMSGGILASEFIKNIDVYGERLMMSIGANFCTPFEAGIPPSNLVETFHFLASTWASHRTFRGKQVQQSLLAYSKRSSHHLAALETLEYKRLSDLD